MIESTDPSLLAAGLRMLWGLVIVLGILLIIYGLMRKRLSFIQSNSRSKIQIKEIRHIMPKKSICLVEVGGQEFLLGLGSESITFLSTIENSEKGSFNATLASATKQNAKHSA